MKKNVSSDEVKLNFVDLFKNAFTQEKSSFPEKSKKNHKKKEIREEEDENYIILSKILLYY